MYRRSSFFKRVPLRSLLVVVFALQTIAAVTIVGWVSYWNGEQAIQELANQLGRETTARIHQNLQHYLTVPQQVVRSNALAIELGQLDLEDLPSLERYFWRQLEIYDSISYSGIGFENREVVGAERSANGSLIIRVSGRATNYELRTYATNAQGNRLQLFQSTKDFDPRVRPWYRAALQANKPAWSEIFSHIAGITSYIAAIRPVYHQDALQGVLLTNINLSQISNFLRGLRVGKTGQSFIMERSGLLVATSTDEQPIRSTGRRDGALRIKAVESSDPLTQATARYLAPQLTQLQRMQQLEFRFAGKDYFLQIQPIRDNNGLDWLIAVVVPKADYMEHIRSNSQVTLLLYLGALVVAIALSSVTSYWISSPIWRLSDASQKIAEGNFGHQVRIEGIRELIGLAASFNQMSQEVQQSRHQLEEYSRSLEQTVAQRTQELQEEIGERLCAEASLRLANQELQRLAYLDGLTQVANRRHFDERLEQEWRRLRREQQPLSLILCDVDFFKQYNDTYGHPVGDDCLRQIAAALIRVVKRPADLIARYGGEEFAVILPNTTLEGGLRIAEEIRLAVRALQLPHKNSIVSKFVTLSLGTASIVPSGETSAAQLLTAADQALYRAKQEGRDRIVV